MSVVDTVPRLLYRHLDAEGALLYVGSVGPWRTLRARHVEHIREARWWRYVERVTSEPISPGREGLREESAAIRDEGAIFNCPPHYAASLVAAEREAAYLRCSAHLARPVIVRARSRRPRMAQLNEELARVGVPVREKESC